MLSEKCASGPRVCLRVPTFRLLSLVVAAGAAFGAAAARAAHGPRYAPTLEGLVNVAAFEGNYYESLDAGAAVYRCKVAGWSVASDGYRVRGTAQLSVAETIHGERREKLLTLPCSWHDTSAIPRMRLDGNGPWPDLQALGRNAELYLVVVPGCFDINVPAQTEAREAASIVLEATPENRSRILAVCGPLEVKDQEKRLVALLELLESDDRQLRDYAMESISESLKDSAAPELLERICAVVRDTDKRDAKQRRTADCAFQVLDWIAGDARKPTKSAKRVAQRLAVMATTYHSKELQYQALYGLACAVPGGLSLTTMEAVPLSSDFKPGDICSPAEIESLRSVARGIRQSDAVARTAVANVIERWLNH